MHTRLLSIAAALAAPQFGLVTLPQLTRAGIGRTTISRWLQAGVVHLVHPGVYAVGHRTLTREARWLAGQLACAPHGRATHWTAAVLLELKAPFDHRPHITLPPGTGARRGGIHVHRSPIPERDKLEIGPWRTTSWARAILDCADIASRIEIEELITAAHDLRIYDHPTLNAVIADAGGRRGLKRLIPATESLSERPNVYRSRSERRVDSRLVGLGIPRPEVNVAFIRADGRHAEIDLFWRDPRLGVELDGPQHALPTQQAHDAERDAWFLTAHGILIRRYPLRGLRVEALAADVRALLLARSP
jgi:hypothetical protein